MQAETVAAVTQRAQASNKPPTASRSPPSRPSASAPPSTAPSSARGRSHGGTCSGASSRACVFVLAFAFACRGWCTDVEEEATTIMTLMTMIMMVEANNSNNTHTNTNTNTNTNNAITRLTTTTTPITNIGEALAAPVKSGLAMRGSPTCAAIRRPSSA